MSKLHQAFQVDNVATLPSAYSQLTCGYEKLLLLLEVADMADSGLGESFLGAFQASLSILLVIATGVIAAQFSLLDASAAKSISSVCVKMFMPALLITKLGSQLHIETANQYWPILGKIKLLEYPLGTGLTDVPVWAVILHSRLYCHRRSGVTFHEVTRLGSPCDRIQQHHESTSTPHIVVERDGHSEADHHHRRKSGGGDRTSEDIFPSLRNCRQLLDVRAGAKVVGRHARAYTS